jgi:hypothetical protein
MRSWLLLAVACASAPVRELRAPVAERCSDLPTCEDACSRGAVDECDEPARLMRASPGQTDATRYAAALSRACDAERAASCMSLIDVVKYAPSLPIDEARASALYRRACELGADTACRSISGQEDGDSAQAVEIRQRERRSSRRGARRMTARAAPVLWAMHLDRRRGARGDLARRAWRHRSITTLGRRDARGPARAPPRSAGALRSVRCIRGYCFCTRLCCAPWGSSISSPRTPSRWRPRA